MIKLNRDIQRRDEIIFNKYDENAYNSGGVVKFENLNLENLKKLFALNFINPNDKQNDCPTAAEILQFIEKYPEYTVQGYTVSIERNDYRVTLTGVYKNCPVEDVDELKDFIALFEKADDFTVANEVYCWFD